jgi:hypothetical protein
MRRKFLPVLAVAASLFGLFIATPSANAQVSVSGDFHIQLVPSPIVKSIKPGVPTDFELEVHNFGVNSENLKIETRKFSVDNKTGQVLFDDTSTPEAAQWTTFAAPKFTIKSGGVFKEKIHIALPKDTGFSYSFAIVVSRVSNNGQLNGPGSVLHGSVADFTLINVDKPGATRKLEIVDAAPDQQVYEYLPAKINVRLRNTGNTIVAPAGSVFFNRNSGDVKPLSAVDINQNRGYILPNTERVYTTAWSDGFPYFKTTTSDDGSSSTDLSFDWNNLANFRFGVYTAKVVVIYNDGHGDIPLQRDVTFWVIPYRTIALIIIIGISVGLVIGRFRKQRLNKAVKKAIAKREKSTKKSS